MTNRSRSCLLFLIATLGSTTARAGVTGRVRFRGPLPVAKSVPVLRDRKACGASALDESLLVSPEGGLANVVVSRVGAFGKSAPPATSSAGLIDQIGCRFVPHVIAAQAGQTLTLGNADRVLHTVHAWRGDMSVFNVGFPLKDQRREVTLSTPGILEIRCDAGHDWMKGIIAVFDHPFFAVSGSDGRFSLPSLPPGRQKLRAWHERLGTRDVDVDVGADGSSRVEIVFEPPPVP